MPEPTRGDTLFGIAWIHTEDGYPVKFCRQRGFMVRCEPVPIVSSLEQIASEQATAADNYREHRPGWCPRQGTQEVVLPGEIIKDFTKETIGWANA